MECCQATAEELKQGRQRCWGCNKKKPIIKICDWTGWEFCFKCWIRDYKYGREHGMFRAIKDIRKIKIQLNIWKKNN